MTMQRPPLDELREVNVKGYEGLYSITRDGRVWAYRRRRWLKYDATQGYLRAPLSLGGRVKYIKVHRLVALTWVPNPRGMPEINHLDGNKQNNVYTNIEWVNRSENMKHHYRLRPKQAQK